MEGSDGNGSDDVIEDPLVFLAQSDSLIVTMAFAAARGLKVDAKLPMKTMQGDKVFTVRGALRLSMSSTLLCPRRLRIIGGASRRFVSQKRNSILAPHVTPQLEERMAIPLTIEFMFMVKSKLGAI